MSVIGRRNNLGIGFETSAGSTVAMDVFLPFLACDLIERHTPIANTSARGIRDDQLTSVPGKKWGEGSVEMILDADDAPRWIYLLMGDYATSSTGLYVHDFKRTTLNQPSTATIYRDRDNDDIVLFPYTVVDSIEISFADDVAKLTANLFSKYPIAELNEETPTYTTYPDIFTWRNAVVIVNNAGTTTELKVREFNVEVNNNAEMIYAPNSNDVDRIICKNFGAAGSMIVDYEASTYVNLFSDLTKLNLTIELTEGTHKFTINMPQVRIDNDVIDTPIDDISKETISFVAEHDGTDSITFQVTNETVESYFG